MNELDDFAEQARHAGLHIRVDPEALSKAARAAHEGLFHAPLLALCILLVARTRQGSLETADLAAWTGATLGRHFATLHDWHRKLEWSLQHRKRCADALVFLENVGLVAVQLGQGRMVRCTDSGYSFLRDVLQRGDDIGLLARGLDRSFRAAERRGLELL